MQLKRKLPWILTGKSLLAVGSIAMVALALVTYTATVTINFSPFFRQGVTSTTWAMTVSSGLRYMPGNTSLPGTSPAVGTPSTYAFYSTTGKGYIQVNLAAPVNTLDFSSFRIYVMTLNATTWNNATMYTSTAFTTAITPSTGLDGTVSTCASAANCATGFLHVNSVTSTFYAIAVSYTLVASPADGTATITFDYTPSLN